MCLLLPLHLLRYREENDSSLREKDWCECEKKERERERMIEDDRKSRSKRIHFLLLFSLLPLFLPVHPLFLPFPLLHHQKEWTYSWKEEKKKAIRESGKSREEGERGQLMGLKERRGREEGEKLGERKRRVSLLIV